MLGKEMVVWKEKRRKCDDGLSQALSFSSFGLWKAFKIYVDEVKAIDKGRDDFHAWKCRETVTCPCARSVVMERRRDGGPCKRPHTK